ncbi:MAG: hypothetical protein EPO68_00145 [Planctomycetota bacterium]|nr:MAG: hypothetical protein EPO68_00145 [Planctomycetota bacterium]
MGAAFVFGCWLVISLPFFALLAWVLGAIGRRSSEHVMPTVRLRRMRTALIAVPAAAGAGILGFVGYAILYAAPHDIDAGIGDAWSAPLGSGYTLRAVDSLDSAYITTPTKQQLASRMRRIAYDERTISAELETGAYLLLDKQAQTAEELADIAQLEVRLASIGAAPARWQTPANTYHELVATADWVCLLSIVVPPGLVLAWLLWRLRRIERRAVEFARGDGGWPLRPTQVSP